MTTTQPSTIDQETNITSVTSDFDGISLSSTETITTTDSVMTTTTSTTTLSTESSATTSGKESNVTSFVTDVTEEGVTDDITTIIPSSTFEHEDKNTTPSSVFITDDITSTDQTEENITELNVPTLSSITDEPLTTSTIAGSSSVSSTEKATDDTSVTSKNVEVTDITTPMPTVSETDLTTDVESETELPEASTTRPDVLTSTTPLFEIKSTFEDENITTATMPTEVESSTINDGITVIDDKDFSTTTSLSVDTEPTVSSTEASEPSIGVSVSTTTETATIVEETTIDYDVTEITPDIDTEVTTEFDTSPSTSAVTTSTATVSIDGETTTVSTVVPTGVTEKESPGEMCVSSGTVYEDGQSVPTFSSCQDSCICNNGSVSCTEFACPSPPPGFLRCDPIQDSDECCPAYNCPPAPPGDDCISDDGTQYENGEFVPSKDLCTDCYCYDGEIVCAYQECPEPASENCKPIYHSIGDCCPIRFECDNVTATTDVGDITTTPMSTDAPGITTATDMTPKESTNQSTTTVSSTTTSTTAEPSTTEEMSTDIPYTTPMGDIGTSTDEIITDTTGDMLSQEPVTDIPVVEQTSKPTSTPSTTGMTDIGTSTDGTITDTTSDMSSPEPVTDIPGTVTSTDDTITDTTDIMSSTEGTINKVTSTGRPSVYPSTDEPYTTVTPEDITDYEISTSVSITTMPPSMSSEEVTTETEDVTTDSTMVTDSFTPVSVMSTSQVSALSSETTTEGSETSTQAQPEAETDSPSGTPGVDMTDRPDPIDITTDATTESITGEEETTPIPTGKETSSDSTPTPTYDSTTAKISTSSTDFTMIPGESCVINGTEYADGETVPIMTSCQESCICKNGSVSCTQLACPPAPPAFLKCASVDVVDQCCPSYNCVTPTTQSSLTCEHGGDIYQDGEFVPSSDLCLDCYCLEGEVVCATQECQSPGDNCTPTEFSKGSCCPLKYECDDVSTETPDVTSIETTVTEDLLTRTKITSGVTKATTPMSTEVKGETDDTSMTETTVLPSEEYSTTQSSLTTLPSSTPAIKSTEVDFEDATDPDEPTTMFSTVIETEVTTPSSGISTSKPSFVTVSSDITTVGSSTTEYSTDSTVADYDDITTIYPEETTTTPVDGLVTTEKSTTVTPAVKVTPTGIPGEGNCQANETTYANGESIPVSSPCHESCTCKNSVVSCELKACPAPPPAFLRCAPVEDPDQCCATYECPMLPTNTTESPGCFKDGIQYLEGEFVQSSDVCEDCYCLDGTILCAVQECVKPGSNCKPTEFSKGSCCPLKYECDESPLSHATDKPTTAQPSNTTVTGSKTTATEPGVTQSPLTSTESVTTEEMTTGESTDFTTKPSVGSSIEDSTDISSTVRPTAGISSNESVSTEPVSTEFTTIIPSESTTDISGTSPSAPVITDDITTSPVDKVTDISTDPSKSPTSLSTSTTEPSTRVTDEETSPDDIITGNDTTDFTPEMTTLFSGESTTQSSVSTSEVLSSSTPDDTDTVTTGISIEDTTVTENTSASVSMTTSSPMTSTEEDITTEKDPFTDAVTTIMPTDSQNVTEPTIKTTSVTTSDDLLTTMSSVTTTKPGEANGTDVTDITVSPTEINSTEEPATATTDVTDGEMCVFDGSTYNHGSSVPTANLCQESCKCNNSTVLCEMIACPTAPAAILRCSPIPISDGCCPSYQCPELNETMTEAPECERDGQFYKDGEYVPSPNECTDCYCMGGEIICALLECTPPGKNCVPIPHSNTTCCPETYECDVTTPDIDTAATTIDTITTTLTVTEEPSSNVSTISSSTTESSTEIIITDPGTMSPVPASVSGSTDTSTTDSGVTGTGELTVSTMEPITEDDVTSTEMSSTEATRVTTAAAALITDKVTIVTEETATNTTDDSTTEASVTMSSSTESLGITGTSTAATTDDVTIAIEETTTGVPEPSSDADKPSSTAPPSSVSTEVTEGTVIISSKSPVESTTDETSTYSSVPTDETTTSSSVATDTPLTTSKTTEDLSTGTSQSTLITGTTEMSPKEEETDPTNDGVITEATVSDTSEKDLPTDHETITDPFTNMTTLTGSSSTEAGITTSAISTATEMHMGTDFTTTVRPFSSPNTTPKPFPVLINETLSTSFPDFTTTSITPSPPTMSSTTDIVLGPGACLFDGKVYVSAQQIPRDDPCDFCFCFRGDIICLQQSCPPPIPGCYEDSIPGFCCPRYECPVTKMVMNVTTTTTPIPTYPPIQVKQETTMCEIAERFYLPGEIVEEASGPCLECICGNDGMMQCEPKQCQAEPMLRKILEQSTQGSKRKGRISSNRKNRR